MSDENQTEPVEAAEAPSKKKKTNNDPLATPAMLVGALGLIACVASIIVSLLF